MTDGILIILAAAILVLAFRQERFLRILEDRRTEQEPAPKEEQDEKLPMKVCRKAEPTIEEQIINLALYNGEDQRGGETE